MTTVFPINTRRRRYRIRLPRQIETLASPVRMEILDAVDAAGPCSVKEMARLLGRAPYTFYYHLKKLAEVGLVVEAGSRRSLRRDEVVYDTPGHPMRFDEALAAKPRSVRGVLKSLKATLRLTSRDIERACDSGRDFGRGRRRHTYGGRTKGWLATEQLKEVNDHIESILSILNKPRSGDRDHSGQPRQHMHAFTFALVRVEPSSTGRE